MQWRTKQKADLSPYTHNTKPTTQVLPVSYLAVSVIRMFDHHVVGTFGDHPIADIVDASFPLALMHVDCGGGAKIVARSVHAEEDDRSTVGVSTRLSRR